MENTLFFPIKKYILNESGLTAEEKGKDKNQLKPKTSPCLKPQRNNFGFAIR